MCLNTEAVSVAAATVRTVWSMKAITKCWECAYHLSSYHSDHNEDACKQQSRVSHWHLTLCCSQFWCCRIGRREEPVPQCFNVDRMRTKSTVGTWLSKRRQGNIIKLQWCAQPWQILNYSLFLLLSNSSLWHSILLLLSPQIHQREPSFYHLKQFKQSFWLWTYWLFPEQWQSQNTKCLDAEVCPVSCVLALEVPFPPLPSLQLPNWILGWNNSYQKEAKRLPYQ